MDSIACKNCSGQMDIVSKHKHSQGLGFFLIVLGVFSVFFIFGAPLGLLFLGVGFYMCNAKETFWLCNSCRTTLHRYEA